MTDGVEKKNGNRPTVIYNGDPLFLQTSDGPGMPLVTNLLTSDNYLPWSRSMRIALGAKVKLGFVNGKIPKPKEDFDTYEQWIRVDYMVCSWIIASISPELAEAFLYTTTAYELWKELEERFGECNGPLLYQLQREIASISQGDFTVSQYFTKLKKLWDELQQMQPLSECSCGAAKQISEYSSSGRLVQFLMGLNDNFDHIRNRILVMDPLPDVNKTYSMILRVERQREVQNSYLEASENGAMFVSKNDGNRQRVFHSNSPKKHTNTVGHPPT